MQYTPHYNLNLPEGTDIVNPLVQDNPNYTAIDTALYDNKLRVVGTATHVKTGTNHALTLGDSDINQFKFVATGDYATGDTFTVDGVTVTPRIADGSSIPNGAFKINSTVLCILDGTVLNLINVDGTKAAAGVTYSNTVSGLGATDVQGAIDELVANGVKASVFSKISPTLTSYSAALGGYQTNLTLASGDYPSGTFAIIPLGCVQVGDAGRCGVIAPLQFGPVCGNWRVNGAAAQTYDCAFMALYR